MSIDAALEIAGQDATIIRSPSNISAKCVAFAVDSTMSGRRRADPMYDYEFGFAFSAESGLVTGDLVRIDSEYYLAAAVAPMKVFDELLYYRGTFYKCNNTVSVYEYSSTTKKHSTLVKASVPCLIRQSMDRPWLTDKAILFKAQAKVDPYEMIMQSSVGLENDCIAIDASQRVFRIGDYIDYFFAEGLAVAQVVWERS